MSLFSQHLATSYRRAHGRFVYTERCLIQRGERAFYAAARNISKGGICIQLTGAGACSLGADVEITLRDFDPISATIRWSHNRTYGFEFLTPVQDHPQILNLIEQLKIGKFGLLADDSDDGDASAK